MCKLYKKDKGLKQFSEQLPVNIIETRKALLHIVGDFMERLVHQRERAISRNKQDIYQPGQNIFSKHQNTFTSYSSIQG